MSSTTGLSSSGSNGKSFSSLQLDASTRDSILARNQARIMSALGIGNKDEFNSGGGLNPLKGLYSAAAASFLKNKQGSQETSSSKGSGSYEKAADIMKKLASSGSSAASGSGPSSPSYVSGPASGGSYKKYAWSGSGVAGSENVAEPEVEEVQETAPAAPADLQPVIDALYSVIKQGGGSMDEPVEGQYEFKVMDIAGTMKRESDRITGLVESDSGTYTFEIKADGAVVIDASKGNVTSAEFDQIKHMLAGSMDGAMVKSTPTAEPSPAASGSGSTTTTESSGTSSGSSTSTSTSTSTTSTTDSTSLASILTTSTSSLLSLLGSGSSSDLGRYNAKLLVTDIQAAGGKVTAKDSNTLEISLNGQAGSFVLNGDRVEGTLGSGSGQIKFEIRANGEVRIDGSDSNAQALANSNALRKAIGATTSTKVDYSARVVKYNRYGTGTGLNLLG